MNAVLVPGRQQSGSVMYLPIYLYILSHILFHCGLLQDVEYNSPVVYFINNGLYLLILDP